VVNEAIEAESNMFTRPKLWRCGKFALAGLWLSIAATTFADNTPEWTSDREHRLLVEVPPVANLPRASDEMVARVETNWDDILHKQQVDLSSLQVVGYSTSTGKVIDFSGNAYATTRGDRPLRFYDAAIPWDFKDHEGYAQNSNGIGLPLHDMPGGLRFFNAAGDGRKGQLVWAHTQYGNEPTTYAIYFNALAHGAKPTIAPAGFIGDGSNRCVKTSDHFGPVFQGRVAIADLNGDGLFDLILGNATGTVLWYPNTGTKGHPKFEQGKLLMTDDGQAIDVGWSSAPVAVDWDHDGKLDLLVCAEKECVVYFHNVGDAKNPKFHLEGLLQADGKELRIPHAPCEEDPGNKIYPVDYYGVPEVVDWNGDGKPDLLIGGYITGRVWYYENVAKSPNDVPELTFKGALQADGRDLDVTWCASPCVVDLDGDGKPDLVSGAMQITPTGGDGHSPDKYLWFYKNVGTRTEPKLVHKPFPAQGTFPYGALATPRSVDWNDDGLPDIVVSTNSCLTVYLNHGTKDSPLFDATAPNVTINWGNDQLGFNQLVDYNHDGWPDEFTNLSVIRLNSGKGAPGLFDKVIPLVGAEKILHPSPMGDHWDYRTLADLDGDGLLDILLGDHQGHVWFHKNIGTKDKPMMDVEGKQLTAGDKPIKVGVAPSDVAAFDVLQGARTAVAAGDFNHDGKTDLAVSDTFGYLRVFLQTPGSDEPKFEPGIEAAVKLEPCRMTAQRVDWNGDGWDDLIAAYANGKIYLLVNKAIPGKAEFEKPRLLDVPPCFGDPWPYVADWNHDGDDDLIIDQYGYTRFVERSFIEYGYRPGQVLRHEERKDVVKAQ
jgi:hypothetical protein